MIEGLTEFHARAPQRQESATAHVQAIPPGGSRQVIVRHAGRKLIGVATVRSQAESPQTVRLGPWGEIQGRIIGDDGAPRLLIGLADGPLGQTLAPSEPIGLLPLGDIPSGIPTDNQARFHVVGLIPGHHYGASAVEYGEIAIGNLFDDVTVAPGQVKDLGDLKVRPILNQEPAAKPKS